MCSPAARLRHAWASAWQRLLLFLSPVGRASFWLPVSAALFALHVLRLASHAPRRCCRNRLLPPGMVGVFGSPSLDHQLQQAAIQLLALGMEHAQLKLLEAAAGASGSCSGRAWVGTQPGATDASGSTASMPEEDVYVVFTAAVQELFQRHGGRLLTVGDPATALQLVAMLRGMAAAHQQVGCSWAQRALGLRSTAAPVLGSLAPLNAARWL